VNGAHPNVLERCNGTPSVVTRRSKFAGGSSVICYAFVSPRSEIRLDEMNPPLARLTGLPRQLAEFSMTIDSAEPDSSDASMLNRAIWHSVKGFDTPYKDGRPVVSRHPSFEWLLRRSNRKWGGHIEFASRYYRDQSFVTLDGYRADAPATVRSHP
jgi:hypothetical protein